MPAPAPIAMVVCDSVYKDTATGKTALIGLFNNISAATFPTRHNRCYVFVSVTDVRKGTRFKLRIVHSETEHVVVELKGPAPKETTPVDMCDLCFELNGLLFAEPGLYFIEFWGDDKILVQRPIQLIKAPKKEG